MVWKILRARFWILKRRLTNLKPLMWAIILGALIFVGALAIGQYKGLVTTLRGPQGTTMLAALMQTGMVLLVFFLMTGLVDTLRRLYLNTDMELLLVTPLPRWALYVTKLITCSQALWIPFVLLTVVVVALGQAQQAPPRYYLLSSAAILALLIISAVIQVSLVILTSRIIPAKKLIPIVVTIGSLGGVAFQQVLLHSAINLEAPLSTLVAAMMEVQRLVPLTALAVGTSLIIGFGGYFLFAHSFYHGWANLQEPSNQGKEQPPSEKAQKADILEGITRPFPPTIRLILRKDWRIFSRDPQRMVGLITGPLTMAVLIFPLLRQQGLLHLVSFWLMLIYGCLFSLNTAQGLGLAAFAHEGANIALLHHTPFSFNAVLWGKFWGNWVPAALAWGGTLLALGSLSGLPLWQSGLLVSIVIWALAGMIATGLIIGGRATDFTHDDPHHRVRTGASLMNLGLCTLFLLLTLIGATLGILQIAPQSQLSVTTRAALSAFPDLIWIFGSTGTIVALIALAGQGLFWINLARLWRLTVCYLESWEIA